MNVSDIGIYYIWCDVFAFEEGGLIDVSGKNGGCLLLVNFVRTVSTGSSRKWFVGNERLGFHQQACGFVGQGVRFQWVEKSSETGTHAFWVSHERIFCMIQSLWELKQTWPRTTPRSDKLQDLKAWGWHIYHKFLLDFPWPIQWLTMTNQSNLWWLSHVKPRFIYHFLKNKCLLMVHLHLPQFSLYKYF